MIGKIPPLGAILSNTLGRLSRPFFDDHREGRGMPESSTLIVGAN
jgi:hypothetical protein